MPPAATSSEPDYYTTVDDEIHFWSKFRQSEVPKAHDIALPNGFPNSLTSPLVWEGADMATREDEWVLLLDRNEADSIERGLKHFKDLQIPPTGITPDTFPLPLPLRERLDAVSAACYEGRGFCVLRGLEPGRFSGEDNALVFMGISAHVAPTRGFQDRRRQQVLCHVVNAAHNMKKQEITQPGFTNGEMSFHNDECEILALYAMSTASTGGKTQICSGWQVYNALAKSRPDVIASLAQPWVLDKYMHAPPIGCVDQLTVSRKSFQDYSEFPPQTLPLVHTLDGKVMFSFSRYPLTGYGDFRKRNSTLPPVTKSQVDALNALQILCGHHAFALPTQEGDIVYINDMALLHGRQPFDEDGQPLQRHLLKLYLRDPKRAWPIPSGLQPVRDRVFGPNQVDGTRQEECRLTYYPGQEKSWTKNG